MSTLCSVYIRAMACPHCSKTAYRDADAWEAPEVDPTRLTWRLLVAIVRVMTLAGILLWLATVGSQRLGFWVGLHCFGVEMATDWSAGPLPILTWALGSLGIGGPFWIPYAIYRLWENRPGVVSSQ